MDDIAYFLIIKTCLVPQLGDTDTLFMAFDDLKHFVGIGLGSFCLFCSGFGGDVFGGGLRSLRGNLGELLCSFGRR